MKFHTLIAITAAVGFAGAAAAQTSPPIGQPSTPTTGAADAAAGGEFGKLDKDRDGSVTKKEAASNKNLAKKWDTLDANKDGKLDQGEFAQFEAEGSASGSMGSDSQKSDKPRF